MNDVPARLVVKRGPNLEQEYSLPATEITIGRSSTNAIAIADPEVSRRHASIRLENNSFIVEDWASTNGTFVNDRQIKGPVTLYSGDIIRLGDTVQLQFLADDPQFQPDVWSQQVITADAETVVESAPPAWAVEVDPGAVAAATSEGSTAKPIEIPEQRNARSKFRRRALGCGCGFLVIVFLCMATVYFLDAYQQGRLLYCGPIRPFFEILLGPFGFAPICP